MSIFTRQLGAESGVQLNPLRDNSEIATVDNYDQIFAIMMRATRGRIDKPFLVDRSNVKRRLGNGEPMRVSDLNEAWVHVVEALNNGAYSAVVQRLTVASASAISYAVATIGSGAVLAPTVTAGAVTAIAASTPGTGYTVGQAITIGGVGVGATAVVATVNATGGILTTTVSAGGSGYVQGSTTAAIANPISFYVTSTDPDSITAPFMFALKHLECFNDGIKVSFRAEESRVGGVNQANSTITLVVSDIDGNAMYEFTGSLLAGAVDDYGNSAFLPDIVANATDAVEVTVGAITSILPTSTAYGYNSNGLQNWAKSGVLVCFSEGSTAYATSDYAAARAKLHNTPLSYGYIASGGSRSAALLAQLAQLAYDTNRQLRMDIPGDLTRDAAITFAEQLAFGASATPHLLQMFWAPLKSNDPTGVNGKGYFGVATLNIAYACRRNAQTDAKGFAPKNYPIAGRAYPIGRTGITQTFTPSDQDLNALARAQINPCVFETYSGGGRYVFRDSLTAAQVESSQRKLIAVADMSTSVDEAIVRYGKDILQLPMETALARMADFLKFMFDGAVAAKWLVPSSDPFMEGSPFKYEVKPNQAHPYDRVDVNYWLRYDGTTRQIFATQTLTK